MERGVSEEDCDVDLDGIGTSVREVTSIASPGFTSWLVGPPTTRAWLGSYLYEQIAGIPTEVDLASEFRYRRPALDEGCMLVPVSQSGETADTLAALREGKQRRSHVISICNTRESTICPRER